MRHASIQTIHGNSRQPTAGHNVRQHRSVNFRCSHQRFPLCDSVKNASLFSIFPPLYVPHLIALKLPVDHRSLVELAISANVE